MASMFALQDADGTVIVDFDDTGAVTIKDTDGDALLTLSAAGGLTLADSSGTTIWSLDSSGFQTAGVGVRRAAGTISSAQLLALNAAPQTLVAAPGAGSFIELVSLTLFLDYNSTAYDGIAAGEDLAVKYTDGSGEEVARVETTGFLDATADARRVVQGPGTKDAVADFTPVANAALVLHLLAGEIATGNSPLYFECLYRVRSSTLDGT